MGETASLIHVDIWADVTCPWCFIGKRRFDRAVVAFTAAHPDVKVEIEGHSYELTPSLRENFTGSEVDFMVAYEGVPRERAERTLEALTEVGAHEGITFSFAEVQHVNTHHLHRLLQFAATQGTRWHLTDRLAEAYFTEGANLADTATVVRLAAEVGIAEVQVRELLADDDLLAGAVDFDQQRAQMLGASGVPFFVFDRKHAVPGALTEEQFVEVLGRVHALSVEAGGGNVSGETI